MVFSAKLFQGCHGGPCCHTRLYTSQRPQRARLSEKTKTILNAKKHVNVSIHCLRRTTYNMHCSESSSDRRSGRSDDGCPLTRHCNGLKRFAAVLIWSIMSVKCMLACMYICMYICMHVCMYVSRYVCM